MIGMKCGNFSVTKICYLRRLLFISCTMFWLQGYAQKAKPNVIFIMVDDLGYKDVGYMGGTFFETPNIDALSKEGLVFTNSYAGAANCAPSRACLMTGQNTPRHGIYTVSPSARGNSKDRKLIPTQNTNVLAEEEVTLGHLFKNAGYVTGTFGKWHLGTDPTKQGFQVNVGGNKRGNPGANGYFSPYNVGNLENGPKGEHLTDRLTTEAIKFIETNKETPFFLYLPYYSVHTPIEAKPELIKKYKAKQAKNIKGINPAYAAMVETTDSNIGRLLEIVKELGLAQNTMVVFTSDNGGIASIATQLPLRAGKGSYYEGGIRVPTIIKWPKVVPISTTDTPIVNLDFYATFKDLLGGNFPDKELDGISIMPLIKGKNIPERPLFWHFPIYLQAYNGPKDDARDTKFRTRPGSVIRLGDWKLHQYFEDNEIELFNLKTDPGERNNVIESHPKEVEKMMGLLEEWRNNIEAPIPSNLNPNYEK